MVTIALTSFAIYFFLILLLYVLQRKMTYFPSFCLSTPKDAGVPEMKIIELFTEDNLAIKGWYSPPKSRYLPTLVYFHGNAGDISNRSFIARTFLDLNYGVFLLTYRGYSGNPGRPFEEGLYADARACLTFLKSQGTPPKSWALVGESIGCAVAIQMATEFSVGALILQAPFSSLAEVAKVHYSFFLPFEGLIKEKYDSIAKIRRIHAPLLILHGKEDTIIPPELSRKLFEKANDPKESVYLAGRGHNDLFEPRLIDAFIRRNMGLKSDLPSHHQQHGL